MYRNAVFFSEQEVNEQYRYICIKTTRLTGFMMRAIQKKRFLETQECLPYCISFSRLRLKINNKQEAGRLQTNSQIQAKQVFIWNVLQLMFCSFLTEKPQHVAFGWPAGYFPSHPTISGILLKFPNCLIYQVLGRSATHDATHIFTFQ